MGAAFQLVGNELHLALFHRNSRRGQARRTARHSTDNLPAGAHWQDIGIGARQWPLVAAAITLGGNVRVGLEDNLYVAPGQLARSNGELVARAAELVRLVGGEVASVAEARELLELPLR